MDDYTGPQDPIGTVRAGDGLLAVRAHSADPDYAEDLVWYIIDIGSDECPANVEHRIDGWPVVYRPTLRAHDAARPPLLPRR